MKLNLKDINVIALFTAVTVILAQISIPIPFSPVPVTLSIFGVFLSSLILGTRNGILSQIVYILLGLVGVPVFAGFRGGLNVLLSPTGGYIISYPFMALVIGLLVSRKKNASFITMTGALLAGLVVCYTLGTSWLAVSAKLDAAKAISAGVIPFLPLDIVKAVISAALGLQIRNALTRAGLVSAG